jgi:hypothetical protein
MTSPLHTSLMAKTAPRSGVGFDVRTGRVGSAGNSLWGHTGPRTAIAEASNDIDALAARSAG